MKCISSVILHGAMPCVCCFPFQELPPSFPPSLRSRLTYRLDRLLLDVPDEAMADLGVDEVGEEEDCMYG